MQRPDDRCSKIGAANYAASRIASRRTRPRERDGRSRDEGPRRFPAEKSRGSSPPRRDRTRDRSRPRRDSPESRAPRLKVISNIIDKCTVSDYAVRDGSFHEGENFYDFLKKLLDQVNETLKNTLAPEAYELKELRETVSPASIGEKRKFSQLIKMPDHMLHCASVIVGLPPCVFFGNGFSERQWSLAKASAGKDMIEKIYRIGFISPRLYESVTRSSVIDEKTRLPDFLKCVRAFVSLEKHMVKHSWPWDVLTAPEQPLAVLDRLKGIFRQVLSEVYGVSEPPVVDAKDARSREEIEIERKIALQREELLRRERAREMVEPLDDSPIVPQQQESSPPSQQKTKWRAEAAPGWKNPVFIYKFLVINSQTKQKQLKCYTFSLHKMGLNIHVCNYCKSLGTTTVIAITDGFFVRDPLKLNHVCFPKLYEEEIRLRTNYSSPQTQAEGLAFLDGGSTSKQAQSRLRHRKPMVLFDATVVASRVGKNPTMYYRSYGDTNLCWSFMYQWERKNGTAIFVCAGCNKHDERVPIPVLGNKFCADPSKLKHVCQPLYWPDEEEKLILREMKRKQPTKKSRKEAKLAELAEEEMCLDQLIKGECNGEVDEPLAKQMKLEEPEQY